LTSQTNSDTHIVRTGPGQPSRPRSRHRRFSYPHYDAVFLCPCPNSEGEITLTTCQAWVVYYSPVAEDSARSCLGSRRPRLQSIPHSLLTRPSRTLDHLHDRCRFCASLGGLSSNPVYSNFTQTFHSSAVMMLSANPHTLVATFTGYVNAALWGLLIN
jgi:hypothetical protein